MVGTLEPRSYDLAVRQFGESVGASITHRDNFAVKLDDHYGLIEKLDTDWPDPIRVGLLQLLERAYRMPEMPQIRAVIDQRFEPSHCRTSLFCVTPYPATQHQFGPAWVPRADFTRQITF